MRVGANDRMQLEAHLDAVAHLRNQIDAIAPACELPLQEEQSNDDIDGQEQLEAVNAALSRLLALAFACDITRVGSIQFTGSVGYTVFNMLGLDRGHHDLTHEAAQNDAVDQATIYTISQFAVFGVHDSSANGENTSDILLSCLQSVDPTAIEAGGGIGLSTTPCTAILA